MKIFPLKYLSPLDKFKNFVKIVESTSGSNNDKVKILNSEFEKKELCSIYKSALKQLSHDKYEKSK